MFKKTNREEFESQDKDLQDQEPVTFVFEPVSDETLKSITGGCTTTTYCTSGSTQYEQFHG